MNNKNKIIILLCILCIITFILGMHGGSEYYFRDFCVHKTLNMFYNNGSPEFFKKPNFVSDIQFFAYGLYYLILKLFHCVNNFDEFVRYFSQGSIPTKFGDLSFMLPALIINNIFAMLGVCFTFFTTYILTDKKITPAFLAGFILATSHSWMKFSHHPAVDIPLSALCIITIFFSIYFIQSKQVYSKRDVAILGILSGLCIATKYNGALILIAPISVLLTSETSIKDFMTKLFILFGSAFGIFAITNPYILIKLNYFIYDFNYEYHHVFSQGHTGADVCSPLKFHLFHSLPNSLNMIVYIFGLSGLLLFYINSEISQKEKNALISFPILFIIVMSSSTVVFQRYILPLVPFIIIFSVYFIYHVINKAHQSKFMLYTTYLLIAIVILTNSLNAIRYYKIMSLPDTRVAIKNIFKTFNFKRKIGVSYSDVFSNPYYEEDFLNSYPELKTDIVSYLKDANNNSIKIYKNMCWEHCMVYIFDSYNYDRTIQERRSKQHAHIDNQFFLYMPYSRRRSTHINRDLKLYAVQVTPYKLPKDEVPFDILRSDFKYRNQNGPYVEIYFKDPKYRNLFVAMCSAYQLNCKSITKEQGYYYKNL